MKDKKKALELLKQKQIDDSITYDDIARQTGYEKRQLIRLKKQLYEKDMDLILIHGNTGIKPVTTASDQEISYLERFKESYPVITIAQFRDIFIEDVINDPDMKEDVIRYGLKPRSRSWFRQLFIKEGWESPLQKPVRVSGDHITHPIRKPRPRKGELVQIDGTEFDWLGTGETYVLHLAVDDATTEVLSGWFAKHECTYGYCKMMDLILRKHGIPEALYTDRDSVFVSSKGEERTPSQFAMMMSSVHIEMIYANSSEAKGRVERYNGTVQNRIPNDIIRFRKKGIKLDNYDDLNIWFNEFYIRYINTKFAFAPADPHEAFLPMEKDFDYSKLFRFRFVRMMRSLCFSYEMGLYSAFAHDTGEQLDLPDGTKITVYQDVFSRHLYIERYNRLYDCIKTGERRRRNGTYEAESQKQLHALLNDMDGKRRK